MLDFKTGWNENLALVFDFILCSLCLFVAESCSA